MLCIACKQSSDEVPGFIIINEELSTHVKGFVKQLISKGGKEKGVVIHLDKAGDTTFIAIVNSTPDLQMTGIKGMVDLQGYNIYITGESIDSFFKLQPERYYQLNLAKFKNRKNTIYEAKFSEPLQWNLVLIRDSLISHFTPKIR
jgi:hypothetical protein